VAVVLVGFAEALAAIESAFSLLDAGYELVAFTREGKRPALASSRSVRVVPVPAPEDDADGCVAAVQALVAQYQPVAILPLDDHSVWVCDRLSADAVVAGPRGDMAHLALDKAIQLALAEKAGLLVPPTTAPSAPGGDGPWMVKPSAAIVYQDGKLLRPVGRVATNPAEVAEIAAKIPGQVLVQPIIEGVGEGVFGFAAGGEVYGLTGHQRVRMMNPRGSGSSACRSVPVDPALVEPTRAFVAESGWTGIFMIELLRDGAGRPWFMELNGRTWGSMVLARRRGLPYPEWAVRAAVDPQWTPPQWTETPHVMARHLGRELVHLLAVLRGARGTDKGHWPRRGATIRAMLRREPGTYWYNTRRGEMRVFIRDTWQTVAAQVSGRG
jgi:hypothetical protein